MGASYRGSVDPDSVSDAGLGMKGDAFYSYCGGCTMIWAGGAVLDMDARAMTSNGGLHALSEGHHAVVMAFPLGRVGCER